MEQGNGHDRLTVRVVEILERIEGRLASMEAETKTLRSDLNTGLAALREELHAFKDETRGELMELHGTAGEIRDELKGIHREVGRLDDRFEAVRLDVQRHDQAHGDLAARVERLEAAVFKKTGS